MICIRIYPNQLPRSARRRSTLALAVIASLNVLIDRVAILLACTSCSSLIDTVASLAVRLGMNRRFRGWNSKPLAVSCLVALLVSLAFLVRQRTRCQQQSSGDGTSIGYTGFARSGNAGKRQRVLGVKEDVTSGLKVRPNTHGLLLVPNDTTGPHPIEGLLAEAEAKAKAIDEKNKGILYLRDAVKDYENTYGMKPPRGFEKW